MVDLRTLLDDGTKIARMFGDAREAYSAWKKAVDDAKPTLSETDQAKLQRRLEAVHAESMAMSQELDTAIAAARKG